MSAIDHVIRIEGETGDLSEEFGLGGIVGAYGFGGIGKSRLASQVLAGIRTIEPTVGSLWFSREVGRLVDLDESCALSETRKTTVRAVSEDFPMRRKAAPKAVALLERFKNVPSVDPLLFRADVDRVLDPGL